MTRAGRILHSPFSILHFLLFIVCLIPFGQLAYRAYKQIGLDLNTGLAMEQLPGTNGIIYPQEIWNGFPHRAAKQAPVVDPKGVWKPLILRDSPG